MAAGRPKRTLSGQLGKRHEGGPAGEDARRARSSDKQFADSLDDRDHPLYTIGQAGELLGVDPGVLRRLEATAGVAPARSSGRHRRYSRTQLEHARRLLHLIDEGISAGGAGRVIALEEENATLRDRLRTAEGRTAEGRTAEERG